VPPSLQIPPHTHILRVCNTHTPYSPCRRRAHSPTAFSGPMARPPRPPPSHIPTGWMVSAAKRRPVRLPRRTIVSRCICRFSRMRARLPPPASSFLTHTRRMDGFCNQNADQLGSLAGLSFPVVYVGLVQCAPASPDTYSSSTHRFPDERTPIEATPLSATSAELVLGLGLGLGLGSHSSSHASSHAPLFLATLLSHNIPFPRVH
jgi:hypothetical protein